MEEFITSSVLGGLLYDSTKKGLNYLNENVKSLIKGYLFNDEEVAVLTKIATEVSVKESYSKIDFVRALEANQEAQNIIQGLQEKKVTIQINNIQTNNGAVMGDNHGTMNFGKN